MKMDRVEDTTEVEKDKSATSSSTVDCCCGNCNNEAKFECLLCLKSGKRHAMFCSRSCYEEHFQQQHRFEPNSSRYNPHLSWLNPWSRSSTLSPQNSPLCSDASSSSCPDSPMNEWIGLGQWRNGRRRQFSKSFAQVNYQQFPDYWQGQEWTQTTVPMMSAMPTTPQRAPPLVHWMPQYLCWVMYP